eukprot:927624-Rhodomonas_salina.2
MTPLPTPTSTPSQTTSGAPSYSSLSLPLSFPFSLHSSSSSNRHDPLCNLSPCHSVRLAPLLKRALSSQLLAGPGMVLQSFLVATVGKFILPYGWDWTESLLFGSILSATDPVAVVALLKELGALPDLRVLIEVRVVLGEGVLVAAHSVEGSIFSYLESRVRCSA